MWRWLFRRIRRNRTYTYSQEEILKLNYSFIEILNQERLKNNLLPVEFDADLLDATNYIVKDNAEIGKINHTDSSGRSFYQRIKDFGVSREWVSEVLGLGGKNSEFTPLDMWKSSVGHKQIILHPQAKKIAISSCYIYGGPYTYFDGISRFWGAVLTS